MPGNTVSLGRPLASFGKNRDKTSKVNHSSEELNLTQCTDDQLNEKTKVVSECASDA